MKIKVPPRLRIEDFPSEYQDLVGKLSRLISSFQDDVYNVLNNGVDFDNLNRQLVDVDLTIDSSGKLINPPIIKAVLRSRLKGINVVNAVNITNSTIYPTNTPFLSWSTNNNLVNILNVTGLQPSSQYRLTLELIA